ncbi:Concanavalin A-like lectin/glucanase, subgroup [Cynara cardunculus var. scolymus]|uniref:non-specific serine/threonine protein kinase n=1 Tax=Cynara cardunculus var. scolymus TaxID=59895 RepID=A0A103YFU0_CYNCS|nr:Concanavalin A-like lectin/glucanase, subgroup [Cynara cardunculus var. scolymus]
MAKSNSRLKAFHALVLVLLCFVHLCFSNETASLIALRKLLLQRKDVISTWFDSKIPPCNWTGIRCEGSVVHQISLSCTLSPPTLPFPRIFREFRSLKHLNISRCGFNGHIYSDFWILEDLETLDLSNNRLLGVLPPSLSRLKKLRVLVLDNNGFSGRLPSTIGQLRNLTELSLNSNSFSGRLPYELGNLVKLKSLDLSLNLFSGDLPSSLGNLTKLTYLDASQNKFTGPIFPEIGNLKMLKSLDLAMNSLTGSIPEAIGALTHVHRLHLHSCKFTGNIPAQMSNMTSLIRVNIGQNYFEGGLPSNFGALTNLVYFIATNAGLSGPIPRTLGNCKKLRALDLSMNTISGPLPDSLAMLESINSFFLHSNHLSGALPEWFSKWKSVESINLSDNLFTGRLPLLNIPSLTFLDLSVNMLYGVLPAEICLGNALGLLKLSNNDFSGTITSTFRNCSILTDLVLSGNNLFGEIPAYLGDLPLITLELSKNRFSGTIPTQLWESKTLMEIYLNSNLLEGHIPAAIGKASTLQMLQMDNNLFEGNIPSSIGQLKNMTNLSLHGNKLAGNIPLELFECTKLVSLDLGSNELTGPIPKSISQLELLDNLVLSKNLLSGPIPEEICTGFQKITLPDSEFVQHYGMLDLSNNELSGPIPTSIKQCIIVTELMLSRNQLDGTIPHEISEFIKSLEYLDVSMNYFSGPLSFRLSSTTSLLALNASNNLFSGALDASISNLTALSIFDVHNNTINGDLPSLSNLAALTYLDLSGNDFQGYFPCSICDIEGLSFVGLSGNRFSGQVPESCNTPNSCYPYPSQHSYTAAHTLTHASVLGIALGTSFVFVVVLLIAFLRQRMLKQEAIILERGKGKNFKATETHSEYGLLRKRPKEPPSINIATFEQSLLRLNPQDILSATENFSKTYIIGDGGFGTVYKALLPEGRTVAVKRLNGGRMHGEREFLAEMETVGKVKHENLVPLMGYCVFADERFLIYEYMANGSLDMWLRNRADAVEALDWPTRFKICLGSATGLAFLHHGFVPHIIHRDIKSSNILLDSKFEPRVSDFGLARIISACESHVSTVLAGTFGYIPPEYGQKMVATTKGDVYSFGVVMLELVTGREPTGQADVEGENLVGWVRWMVANRKESEVLDPCFYGSWMWKDQMLGVLAIAQACTNDQPRKRPTMLDVVKSLKELKTETGFAALDHSKQIV